MSYQIGYSLTKKYWIIYDTNRVTIATGQTKLDAITEVMVKLANLCEQELLIPQATVIRHCYELMENL